MDDPNAWVSWVPEWPTALFKIDAYSVVLLNGIFESILGMMLLLGLWTRWVALFLSLHLFFIAYEIGYNDIGVRDFTLAVATLSLALWGDDCFSILSLFRKREQNF
ncbi:DoxX family membrane protein [Candidatus Kaiserbacteria bacterium]|nr:DoxX family membrane protein [Candidatus Kaiserbacteria bacterium]